MHSFIGRIAATFYYLSNLAHFDAGALVIGAGAKVQEGRGQRAIQPRLYVKGPRPVYNREREKARRRRQAAKIENRRIAAGFRAAGFVVVD